MQKILLFIFTFSSTYIFATNGNQSIGARSAGLGNASVTLSDVWSTQNNQAGLGYLKKINAGIYYENKFSMKELSLKAAAFAMPVKAGTFGLMYSSFGYSQYNESKLGLSFAKSFGEIVSAGVQLNYISTRLGENYGNSNKVAAELGIQAKPIRNLIVGAHIFNPTRTKLATYDDERIPTIMKLGFNYTFSEKVFVVADVEKDVDFKAIYKAGVEYKPIKELYFRVGVSSNPNLTSFGIGVNLKQFKFDFSSSFHSVLGYTPHIGLTYEFK